MLFYKLSSFLLKDLYSLLLLDNQQLMNNHVCCMDFPRQLEEVGKQIHAYQIYEYICITYDYLFH